MRSCLARLETKLSLVDTQIVLDALDPTQSDIMSRLGGTAAGLETLDMLLLAARGRGGRLTLLGLGGGLLAAPLLTPLFLALHVSLAQMIAFSSGGITGRLDRTDRTGR